MQKEKFQMLKLRFYCFRKLDPHFEFEPQVSKRVGTEATKGRKSCETLKDDEVTWQQVSNMIGYN